MNMDKSATETLSCKRNSPIERLRSMRFEEACRIMCVWAGGYRTEMVKLEATLPVFLIMAVR